MSTTKKPSRLFRWCLCIIAVGVLVVVLYGSPPEPQDTTFQNLDHRLETADAAP